MYDSSRTRHHGSQRSSYRVSGRSSRIYHSESHSNLWARWAKLQRSLWTSYCLHRKTISRAQRLHSTAQVYERCLWCGTEQNGCTRFFELFQGPHPLCQACEEQLKPCSIKQEKWLDKPVYYLFEQTQSLNRLLVRLFRFQDVTPAPLFLAYSPFSVHLFQAWPLRIVGFEESDPAIQALFQDRTVRFLKEVEEKEMGKAIPYLAFSPFPLNQKEMEEILSDPDCQGLCLLTQSKEEINAFQDKNKHFFTRIFSLLIR